MGRPGIFFSIFKHEYNFATNMRNGLSSIWRWDSNPRPSEHEAHPMTTRPKSCLFTGLKKEYTDRLGGQFHWSQPSNSSSPRWFIEYSCLCSFLSEIFALRVVVGPVKLFNINQMNSLDFSVSYLIFDI